MGLPPRSTADTVVTSMSQSHRAAPATRTAKPTKPKSPASHTPEPVGAARWLLLIHQIPPKPDYLRVKIGRRLQRVGAVAIKNSVYVLPPTADAYEDFQWIVREIEEGGGDAFLSGASLVGEGLTGDGGRARFNAARNEEYAAIAADCRDLLKTLKETRPSSNSKRRTRARSQLKSADPVAGVEQELAKLRRRYETVRALDFFAAPDGAAVSAVFSSIEQIVQRQRSEQRTVQSSRAIDGATWVTRKDVHVDRIASAW